MNQKDTSQTSAQRMPKKEMAIKASIFVFLIYFFTFTGSALFNLLFIELTIRIIMFLAFFIIIGAVLGFMPWLHEYLVSTRKGETAKENAISIKKLLTHVLIGAISAGLLCFLFVLLPYICKIPQTATSIISQVFKYAGFAFIVVFFWRMEKRPLKDLGLERKNVVSQILIGLGLGVLTCFVFSLLPILCKIVPAKNWVSKPSDITQIAYTVLSNLLLIGTVEELIFRGYLQTSIANSVRGNFTGVLTAAALFGIWHIFNGNIINVGMTFLIGAVLGFGRAYLKNCSLLSVMLAHALNNILIMVIAFIYL